LTIIFTTTIINIFTKFMKITKRELKQIYLKNSNKKACEILKITNATLTKYLRQNKIKLKGSGNRNKRGKLVIE
jgi:hypothetical protein